MYEQWLAACIDCDGCISIAQYPQVAIGFGNSSKEMATIFELRAKSLNCRTHMIEQVNEKGKIFYTVIITGTHSNPGHEDKVRFLKAILPHLIIKKKKAEKAIEVLEAKLQRPPKGCKYKFEDIMESGMVYSTRELSEIQEINTDKTFHHLDLLSGKGVVKRMGLYGQLKSMHWTLAEESDTSLNIDEREWHKHR